MSDKDIFSHFLPPEEVAKALLRVKRAEVERLKRALQKAEKELAELEAESACNLAGKHVS